MEGSIIIVKPVSIDTIIELYRGDFDEGATFNLEMLTIRVVVGTNN